MIEGKWARDIHYYEHLNVYLKNYLEFKGTKLTATNHIYEDKECTTLLYIEVNQLEFNETAAVNSLDTKAETEAGVITSLVKKSCKITPVSDKGIAKLKNNKYWTTLDWKVGVEKTLHPMAHIKLVEKDMEELIAARFNKDKNLYFDNIKYSKVQTLSVVGSKKP